ncbi:fimbria/pilus periplasmic chaperone [Providencia rettgeri]|uniref:fimbria/pilus periplasmic chaperone n=1 Tax=Providencia rettgeri TaxID=587 RepID=UPI0009B88CE7
MMKNFSHLTLALLLSSFCFHVNAAISLDRTRAIFNGNDKTISLSVTNNNKNLPYLAQGWIEDENGKKIESPLIVLPPVQRVEPDGKTQVRIQSLSDVMSLPQDRETLFYFNLREIPPKSKNSNVLQIALQTRIKLFYRPKSLVINQKNNERPWQENVYLESKNGSYTIYNPTGYYVTIVDATKNEKGKTVKGFNPIMIPPKSHSLLQGNYQELGVSPVLTYINDYGGRPKLRFNCSNGKCISTPIDK